MQLTVQIWLCLIAAGPVSPGRLILEYVLPDIGSISHWLERFRTGDRSAAVQALWAAYFERLVRLAQRRLGKRKHAAADAEDVALCAFDSFVRAVEAGRFPRLDDREDLWQVLFLITVRKAADVIESESRTKRGGGMAVLSLTSDAQNAEQIASVDPGPGEVALLAEQVELLLLQLSEPMLRSIAVWKLEGFTNLEIAKRIGRSEPTVERKLRRIRQIWQPHDPQ